MRAQSFYLYLFLILGNALCLSADPIAESKLFVDQCLADSETFVVNPPADRNPYKGMKKQEIQALQMNAFRNGSILMLYSNGIPLKFESRKGAQPEGESKSWHSNGLIRATEFYRDQKIQSGRYFDESGKLIAEINDGNGIQIVYHRSKPEIRSTCELQHGLKHGLETSYHNYSEGSKQSEAQYEEGHLHGIQRNWMPSGQLNSEVHYQNGKQHGSATHWHRNGNLQSTMQYSEGTQIGKWKRFYENGVQQSEYSDSSQRVWYPSGQLLLQKETAEHGVIVRAQSYDNFGAITGEVINGKGHLVTGKDLEDRFSKMQLELYTGERVARTIQLPSLSAGSSFGANSQTLSVWLQIKAPSNAEISSGRVRLILPDGVQTSGPSNFDIPQLQSGYTEKLGNVNLQLPATEEEWDGQVFADVQLMIEQLSIHYSIPIYQSPPQKQLEHIRLAQSAKPRKPKPRPAALDRLSRQLKAPTVDGTTLPPLSYASAAWTLGDRIWILYQDPAQLIVSEDKGRSWECIRESFNDTPEVFHVIDEQTLLLWSTGTSEQPNLGIPHRVELSKDAGETWKTLNTPEMDMLIGVSIQNKILVLTGINIPAEGIPEGKDIFELPRTAYLSSDFVTFSAQPGSLWTNVESIQSKSLAPNGSAQVFFANASFLDSSYRLYWSDSRHCIPQRVLSPGVFGELVWSKNSAIIAVKSQGKFIAYYNRSTREAKNCPLPYERASSQKDKDVIAAFDLKAKQLLQTNGGIAQ